eukprot:824414-Prymnesium_polylepis.1
MPPPYTLRRSHAHSRATHPRVPHAPARHTHPRATHTRVPHTPARMQRRSWRGPSTRRRLPSPTWPPSAPCEIPTVNTARAFPSATPPHP